MYWIIWHLVSERKIYITQGNRGKVFLFFSQSVRDGKKEGRTQPFIKISPPKNIFLLAAGYPKNILTRAVYREKLHLLA